MKKFLLSLCAIAVAGVCMFMTSCKDDDDPIIYNNVAEAIQKVQDQAAVYTYTLNGQTYNTPAELQAAINALPADTEFTITVTETKGGESKTATSNGRTPKTGQSGQATIIVPSIDQDQNIEVVVDMTAKHNGGGLK
jgi:hypothetical protein